MTESGFWVGPAADPHRFRLTHLLGSGGEGEVWRAQDRVGTEYAVKISPADSPGDDAWEARLQAMHSLDVPGLVGVLDSFSGPERHRFIESPSTDPTHRYVAMEYVEGLSLRHWLDENPDASVRARVRLLRRLARTVDALHAGPAGYGSLTHGDIKPTNVIVRPDGMPVLVDLGLLRPTGVAPVSGRSSAYSSPELRSPGGHPTRQTDTFAFAVTAMETITGGLPPLTSQGFLDVDAVRALVRRNRAMRFRPALRRQLMRGLAAAPERRPRRIVAIFTAGRRVALAGTVLAATFSGGSAFALRHDHGTQAPRTIATQPRPTVTTSPTVIVEPPKAPTTDEAEPSAPPAATPTAPSTAVDEGILHVHPSHNGNYGRLYLVRRASLMAHLEDHDAPVEYDLTDGWGPSGWTFLLSSRQELHVSSVTFEKETTAPSRDGLADAYDVGGKSTQVSPPTLPGHVKDHEPLKSSASYTWDMASSRPARETDDDPRVLGVLAKKPGSIFLDSSACSGNYRFWITISFSVADDASTIYTHREGPFLHYATANDMPFVTSLLGNNNFLTSSLSRVSGHADGAGCRGPIAKPYDSAVRGREELLAKYVAEVAERKPDLSPDQVLQYVAQAIAPAYDAPALAALCDRAASEGWRYRCGPAGTSTAGPGTVDPTPAQVVP